MTEIVQLTPLLLIALLADPAIMLFVLLPPFLFGGTFALIEWIGYGLDPARLLEIFQIGMYTGTTAMISEFTPLFLTGVALVLIRQIYRPASWQFGILGTLLSALFGVIHLYLTPDHIGDIIGMVAVAAGISAGWIDRHQKRYGRIPPTPQQLALAPHSSGDLTTIAFQSDRLDFRSIDVTLAETVFETFTPEVTRFMIPRAPRIPAESEQFLRESLARMRRGEEIVLSIHSAVTGRFIGMCGIHPRSNAATPELGIWIREDAQKRGYGSEAIHALIQWGSTHLICDHFLYVVHAHNHPSRVVAEANGGTILPGYPGTDPQQHPEETVVYALPRYRPDPETAHARIVLWMTQGAVGASLYSEQYRLTRERDIRLDTKPSIMMQAYTITGRFLTTRNQRMQQQPSAWIEAGERIRDLIRDPDQTLVFFSRDAALALAIARIHARVTSLLSVEIISALTLDPAEPVITNRHEPLAPIQTVASIPNNYYVLIFAINGRQKFIYHFRSNGTLVFEDVHTMGAVAPQPHSAAQQLG